MDRDQMKKYRTRLERIRKIKIDIMDLEERTTKEVNGTVKTSMSNFPYLQCRTVAAVYSTEETEQLRKKIKEKQKELERLIQLNNEVEQYIAGIKNERHKTVLEEYYMEYPKKRQQDIAEELGWERSNIAKILQKY